MQDASLSCEQGAPARTETASGVGATDTLRSKLQAPNPAPWRELAAPNLVCPEGSVRQARNPLARSSLKHLLHYHLTYQFWHFGGRESTSVFGFKFKG